MTRKNQMNIICLITLLFLTIGWGGTSDASVALVSRSQATYLVARTETGQAVSTEACTGRTVARLNLRKGPSQTESVIATLDADTALEIKQWTGLWFRVQAGSLNGWVSANYVRITSPEAIAVARCQTEAAPVVKQTAATQEQEPITAVAPIHQPKGDLKKLQGLVEPLRNRLHTSEQTQQQLTSELDTIRKEMRTQRDATARLETARKVVISELASTRDQLKELREAQQDIVAKSAEGQKQLGRDLTAARAQLKWMEKTLQDLQTDRQSLTSELARVSEELEKQRRVTARSKTAPQDMVSELARVRTQIVALSDTLKAVQTSRGVLNAELTALRQELIAQREAADRSQSAKKAVEIELTSTRDQLKALREALQENERKATLNVEATQKALMAELAAARKHISALATESKVSPKPAEERDTPLVMVPPSQPRPTTNPQVSPPQKGSTPKPETTPVPIRSQDQMPYKAATIGEITQVPTPVEVPQTPRAALQESPDLAAIDPFVRSWARDWARKDVKAYLAHYAREFRPPGGISPAAWHKQRQKHLLKPAFIEIEIDNIQKKMTGSSSAQVTFSQTYRSNVVTDQVIKTLDVQWENRGWTIVKETSKAR
jgi:predicted  nucleic acid-binding Zn-ribbon protein/uncharacterized protein YraI